MSSFNIWNNLDEVALYLGLERLDSETNESFYNRIRKFGQWRYKTDYYTQVHSIPLQLALDTKNLVKIYSPYKYKCNLDWEYFTLSNSQESLRVFIGGESSLSKILNCIENSSTFSYRLYDENLRDTPCKTLIRNSNIKRIEEYIPSNKSRLTNCDIVPGSIVPKSFVTLRNEKENPTLLNKIGDYFIEYKIGYIEFLQNEFDGGFIQYDYYDNTFCIEFTEMNLIPFNNFIKYGITDDSINMIPYLLNSRVWGK